MAQKKINKSEDTGTLETIFDAIEILLKAFLYVVGFFVMLIIVMTGGKRR